MNDEAPNMPAQAVDLRSIVDDHGINAYRFRILFLILLAMFADGFDGSSISFAAPLIAREWSIDPKAMGSIFSIGLVGIVIGGGVAALCGDWLGRRRLIVASALFCSVATLGTAWAHDLASLAFWRFVTGLGVGALSPICLVMATEFAPARIRATVMACMFLGLTAGGQGAAGLVAAKLAPVYGWEALFMVGAGLSFVTTLLLAAGLPESLKHLYVKHPRSPKIAMIARRLRPEAAIGPDTVFTWRDEVQATGRVPLNLLFKEGRWRITPVLWVVYFCAQMTAQTLMLWLPTLLQKQGLSAENIASAVALNGALGLVGAFVSSRFMDRFGVICHAAMPLIGIPLIILLAFLKGDMLILAIAVTGFSVHGTLIGMSVMVGFFYPTAVRSTGVGLAVFISRFGAIVGPLALGWLLSRTSSIQHVFYAFTIPLIIAGVGMFVLGLLDRPRFEREKAAQAEA